MSKITRTISAAGASLKKAAPDIFLVVGIGLIVGGAVGIGIKSKEGNDILKCHNEEKEKIEKNKEFMDEKTSKAKNRELYRKTGKDIVKTYAAPVTCVAGGIFLVTYSHVILKKENAKLLAACMGIDKAYKTAINQPQENEEATDSIDIPDMRRPDYNPYAFFFDKSCDEFKSTPEFNYHHAVLVERVLNKKCELKGKVWLNECYAGFGKEETDLGQVIGWRYDPNRPISLGLPDKNDPHFLETLKGFGEFIYIDPNVDGVIVDLTR